MSVTDPIDSSDLDGLDPYDLLDQEAARIDAYLSTLTSRVDGAVELERPSRCAGWSVGDVVRHLAGDEVYFRACLDDEVGELVPVPVDESEQRRSWRVRFSRVALKETKPDSDLASRGEATEVTVEGRTVLLDPDTFIEAVAGRLGTDAPLEPDVRHALSTMP